MDITGKRVKHKGYGTGTVISVVGEYIDIIFDVGKKRFPFPDIFATFISTDDVALGAYTADLLQKKETAKIQIIEQKKLEQQKQIAQNKTEVTKKLKHKRANIAFKCNYCDGGKSGAQIGFDGVCSDEMIYNNIEIQNRTWCNSNDCACLQYLNHEITRKELDDICNNDGFVCYESQMLRDWKALAGIVQNGERKGEPMKLHHVQRNSLCVLTTRTPDMEESKRFIFAVFLVDETYEGDGKEEGYVSTGSKYKIKLAPQEASKLLFWNYHANGNKAETPAWSSGLHRYFDDEVAVQILHDIVALKKGSDQEHLAIEFLDEFCRVNGIDKNNVEEPNGALKRR